MKSEKGQSLVEFALVIPILLMLLFAITDFGRVFHYYLTMDHAGREIARAASVGDDITMNQKKTEAETEGMTVLINKGSSGQPVTVTISYSVDLITPLANTLVSAIPLNDITVMRVE